MNRFSHNDIYINIKCMYIYKHINDDFDPYNVLLSIATNIPVLLMTALVLQGHMKY